MNKYSEIKENLIKKYINQAFTLKSVIPFSENGKLYFKACDIAELLQATAKVERNSSKNGGTLKLKGSNKKELYNKVDGKKIQKCIFSAEQIERLYQSKSLFVQYKAKNGRMVRMNRGDIFEMLFTAQNGQHWKKDNISYKVAGDVELDGTSYQVKYYRYSA